MSSFNDINTSNNGLIIGRNSVMEAIKNNRTIEHILVTKESKKGSIIAILAKARENNILVKEVSSKKLDYLCQNANHQGLIAISAVKEYVSIEDILDIAKQRNEHPFILILDEIEDPHNLGAIIRTAECVGVHGIIIPKRRSVGLTFIVDKASCGAIEYVPVAKVSNISDSIQKLKEKGVWVYGADMDGKSYTKCDFSGAVAIVIGNEGKGISKLVKQNCDDVVSIPMKGQINSLNASVAAGILMYAVSSYQSLKLGDING